MAGTKVTKYGVARGKKILTESGFANVQGARAELAHYEKTMRSVGLEPDVRLVEYDVETTVTTSAPRAYVEPTPETDAPTESTDTTD